jgi:DNA-directed RNA polymerase subunit beta
VLLKEMQSLALDVAVISEDGGQVEVREEDDELLRAAEELGIDLSPGALRAAARQPTGQEVEEGQEAAEDAGLLVLPADETLEDIDDVVDAVPAVAADDEEDAPVGALEDIDLEIEE